MLVKELPPALTPVSVAWDSWECYCSTQVGITGHNSVAPSSLRPLLLHFTYLFDERWHGAKFSIESQHDNWASCLSNPLALHSKVMITEVALSSPLKLKSKVQTPHQSLVTACSIIYFIFIIAIIMKSFSLYLLLGGGTKKPNPTSYGSLV